MHTQYSITCHWCDAPAHQACDRTLKDSGYQCSNPACGTFISQLAASLQCVFGFCGHACHRDNQAVVDLRRMRRLMQESNCLTVVAIAAIGEADRIREKDNVHYSQR